MSVSGVGPAHRPRHAAGAAPARAGGPGQAPAGRNEFAALTDADRALIEHATGQKIGPGFDPSKQSTSIFAETIAAARENGRLGPGQKITAVYLKDLNRQYERGHTGMNPIKPYLDKALAYLNGRDGHRGVDVNA